MSLLVLPNSPAVQARPSASNGNVSQQQAEAGNFSQALNHSLNSQDKTPDQASDSAASIVKPTAPGKAPRPDDADKDSERQDDASLAALAFMPQAPAAVHPLAAESGFGSASHAPSAAEKQLNAAIAAASGKPGVQAAPAQPATASSEPQPLATGPAASPLEALAPANAATPARTAAAGKEPGASAFTTIAHGAELPSKQTVVDDSGGKQASAGGGESHADRHEKIEKSGKQDGRGNGEFATRHVDSAAVTAAANEAAAVQPGAAASSRLPPDMAGQLNPVLANSHVAANPNVNNTALPEPPQLMLTPAVGSDGWAPALGKQMVWLGNSGSQTAELHLNPPELGPLKVTLTLNDNQAQAMFVSAHQAVRSALEAALPQLRNSLADSGINLGHTSVSADTQQQQQQSAFAQNQGGQQGAPSHFQRSAAAAERNPLMERNAIAAALSKNGNGKVDIFA